MTEPAAPGADMPASTLGRSSRELHGKAVPAAPARQPRRDYIDWLRGLAVLIMIMWHSIDSWHVREGRDTFAFGAIIFLAGWAAPLFLFLAGLCLPMAGLARIARGVDRRTASRALMRRGFEVLIIAHLFRFQSFLLNANARWSGLLKPDILNILGIGMMVAALCWGRAETSRGRLLWLLLPAFVVVVLLAPLAPTWWWPTLLHPRLEAYIRPVGNQGVFSLFPAVGYLFAGTFVGAILAERRPSSEPWFHSRAAMLGAVLTVVCVAVAFIRISPAIGFWIGPLIVVAGRIGAMLVLLAAGRYLLSVWPASPRSPLMVFGRTSLFVYWVHVELAYGNFSYPIRSSLTLPWAVAGYLGLTALMFGLAVLWLRRPRGPLIPSHMAAPRPSIGLEIAGPHP